MVENIIYTIKMVYPYMKFKTTLLGNEIEEQISDLTKFEFSLSDHIRNYTKKELKMLHERDKK